MKTNLKTLKRIAYLQCTKKMVDTIQAFEKELKELKYPRTLTAFGKGWDAIIEEILGE